MPPSIDVVVPVYDNYALTSDCLAHLAAQTVEHRTIVVDDGSTDSTPELVRRDWPDATVIELGAKRGYTAAVNRGVQAGDGELVVLLNNDVQLRPDFLERLIEPLSVDPALGSAAALMLRPDELTIDSFGVSADVTLAGFARLQGHPPEHATRVELPVLCGPEGTAGGYRRSAWQQVGGLDETIVAYMEILDLALRLSSAGWRTTGTAGAIGVHLGSATYGHRSPAQRRLAGFSRGYLLRRYGVLGGHMGARASVRTCVTEAIVVVLDALTCRDTQALRGRLAGWRAARSLPAHSRPPHEAIDTSISLSESLMLRRGR